MLNIVALFLPSYIKNKLPLISKYFLWVLGIIFVVGTLYVAGSLINKNLTNAAQARAQQQKELVQKSETIVAQEKKIEEQKRELDQIKQSIEELKASHEQTLASVNELKQEQKKIQITVTKKKQIIEKELSKIENLDIPQEDKDAQKSLVLIQGLNDTYCELFKDSCKAGVN